MSFIDKNGTLHFFCGDGSQSNTFHHFERDASSITSPNDWKHSKIEIANAELNSKVGSLITVPTFSEPPTLEEAHFFVSDPRGRIYRINPKGTSIVPVLDAKSELNLGKAVAFWMRDGVSYGVGISQAPNVSIVLFSAALSDKAYTTKKLENVPQNIDLMPDTTISVLVTSKGDYLFWADTHFEIHMLSREGQSQDWQYTNLTKTAVSKKAFSAPLPCGTTPTPLFRDNKTIHVYYTSTAGSLEELIKRREKPWKHVSLINYVSGTTDLKPSVGTAMLSEIHVFFLSKNRHLMEILWAGSKWRCFDVSNFAICKIKIERIISVTSGHSAHVFATEKHTGQLWHFHWNQKWLAHCLTELPAAEKFVPPHSGEAEKIAAKALRSSNGLQGVTSESSQSSSSIVSFFKSLANVILPSPAVPHDSQQPHEPPAAPAPPPPPPQSSSSSTQLNIVRTAKPTVIQLPRKPGKEHQIPHSEKPLRLVIVSDTHNYVDRIPMPKGDILIHAGDFTVYGSDDEIKQFRTWLEAAEFTHKVVINGNHEVRATESRKQLQDICHFLDNNLIHLCGIKVYGTSWKTDYDLIPDDTDILITHKPPSGHGDIIYTGESRGSDALLAAVQRVKPHLHIFGHNHEGYGASWNEYTTFINAATAVGGAKSVSRRQAIVVDYYPAHKDGYTGVSSESTSSS